MISALFEWCVCDQNVKTAILERLVAKSAAVAMEIFVPRKMATALHTVPLAGMEPAARMVKSSCFITIYVVLYGLWAVIHCYFFVDSGTI